MTLIYLDWLDLQYFYIGGDDFVFRFYSIQKFKNILLIFQEYFSSTCYKETEMAK